MKKFILLISSLIFSSIMLFGFETKKSGITQYQNDDTKLKAEKLIETYEFIMSCTNDADRSNYDLTFFNYFPSSFQEMEKMFGYDDINKEAPLYFNGQEYILYFSNLTSIKPDLYYKKYIDICIDGVWQADNISNGFFLHKRFLKDKENACIELNKRSDKELKSAFKFIFDGPHPDNKSNKKINLDIQNTLSNKYERIKKLINYSLEKIIKDRKHEH